MGRKRKYSTKYMLEALTYVINDMKENGIKTSQRNYDKYISNIDGLPDKFSDGLPNRRYIADWIGWQNALDIIGSKKSPKLHYTKEEMLGCIENIFVKYDGYVKLKKDYDRARIRWIDEDPELKIPTSETIERNLGWENALNELDIKICRGKIGRQGYTKKEMLDSLENIIIKYDIRTKNDYNIARKEEIEENEDISIPTSETIEKKIGWKKAFKELGYEKIIDKKLSKKKRRKKRRINNKKSKKEKKKKIHVKKKREGFFCKDCGSLIKIDSDIRYCGKCDV